MKKNTLHVAMIVVLIAGLMNLAIGVGGFILYFGFNVPHQLQQFENTVNSITSLTQELVTNVDQSVNSVNSLLDTTEIEMTDISNSFYKEAQFFWDWNVLGYFPETTLNIGDSFNSMHQSIDVIIPSLNMVKGNLTQLSSSISSINTQLNSIRTSSSAMINYLKLITPIVCFACVFFIIQGLALISIYFNGRNR